MAISVKIDEIMVTRAGLLLSISNLPSGSRKTPSDTKKSVYSKSKNN